ncbi:hypothetical protein GEMRC1_011105 [Eukaryota sp. GEM-RC1]
MFTYVPTVLNACVPSLITILVGFVAIMTNVMQPSSISQINSFIFRFAVPCLLFRLMAELDLSIVEPSFIIAVIVFKITSLALSLLICKFSKHLNYTLPLTLNLFTIWSSLAWTNSVILGIPIGLAMFGDIATRYSAICGTLNSMVHIPVSIMLLEPAKTLRNNSSSKSEARKRLTKTVLLNKSIIAVFLGLSFTLFGIQTPATLNTTIDYLSNTVIGGSLFCIGMFMGSRFYQDKEDNKLSKEDDSKDDEGISQKSKRDTELSPIGEIDSDVSEPEVDDATSVKRVDSFPHSLSNISRVSSYNDVQEIVLSPVEDHSDSEVAVLLSSDCNRNRKVSSVLKEVSTVLEPDFDPTTTSLFIVLLSLRFIVAPVLMFLISSLFQLSKVSRDVLLFLYILPNALTVFTFSKEYNVSATLLNRMVMIGVLALPVVVFTHSVIFSFDLQ